jgi:hypothetical protein
MSRSLAVAAFALSGLARTPLATGNASSGDWYEQRRTCTGFESSLCGDGCTVDLGSCRDGQCYTLMGDGPVECAPAAMGCDESDTKTFDGGCCPEFTFYAGSRSCVEMSCESELQYNCDIETSVEPNCSEEPTAPAELGENINGTVMKCTRGSAVCYALDFQAYSGSWSWTYIDGNMMYLANGCDSPISGAVSSHGLAAPLLGLLLPAAGLLSAA